MVKRLKFDSFLNDFPSSVAYTVNIFLHTEHCICSISSGEYGSMQISWHFRVQRFIHEMKY